MNTIVVQKAVILDTDGEMLMVRRSKTDVRRPLEWDLPGGFREPDEGLIEGVAREVKEETGLDISDLTPVYSKTEVREWRDDTGKHTDNVVFIFYLGHTSNETVKLSYEHDKFQWSSIKSAIEEFEYPLHKELLTYIFENKLA